MSVNFTIAGEDFQSPYLNYNNNEIGRFYIQYPIINSDKELKDLFSVIVNDSYQWESTSLLGDHVEKYKGQLYSFSFPCTSKVSYQSFSPQFPNLTSSFNSIVTSFSMPIQVFIPDSN